MSDESQSQVPRSFIERCIPPHAIKPTETRAFIAERYEFCAALALSLVDHPQLHAHGSADAHARSDALALIHRGLLVDDQLLSEREADWVVKRIEEMLTYGTP